jgi:hypothetical protein
MPRKLGDPERQRCATRKMKKKGLLAAVLIACATLANESQAWQLVHPLFFGGYTNSSIVVRAPEKVGGAVGFIGGGILTVPVHLITQNFGDPGDYVIYACEGGREGCSFVLGAPFWMVEGVFWRWPKSIFTQKKHEDAQPSGAGYSPPADGRLMPNR